MKKINYLGLAGVGLSALLLAGCGGKAHTLTCELKSGTQSNHVEIEFNSDETKAEKIYVELSMDIGEGATDEQIEQTKEYLIQGCEEAGNKKCSAKVSGTKLTYSFETTPDGSNFDANGKLEDVKKAAEEDGYTCK